MHCYAQNQLRRFQASTFQPQTRNTVFLTQMPLRLDPGWNKIEINLADFTHRAYGTRYMETVAIRINANIRLRRIYFSDQLYAEADKPFEYRLLITQAQNDKIPDTLQPGNSTDMMVFSPTATTASDERANEMKQKKNECKQ